jgi:2,3-bisphosphoglycerate-dependent phosphoglycerate mutase
MRMKKLSLNHLVFRILLIALLFANFGALAQKTTVWVVRHAEKDETNPDERNPELTKIGQLRAEELAKHLRDEKISAIFSTEYKRTIATGGVLAQKQRVTTQFYKPTDFSGLAAKVLGEYKGKNVLVIGHSNTLMPVIAAFSAKTPVTELKDDDYDFIFKVVIDEDGKATVTAAHYGEKHHSTAL